MKNKTKILCALCLLCVLCVVSCNDDKDCVPPAFKGFTYQPSLVHAGDTVTITACYLNRGQYVYGPTYQWTVSVDTLDAANQTGKWQFSKSVKGSIGDPDPSVKVAIPQSAMSGATVTCNFTATYNNSVDGVTGTGVSNTTQEGYYGVFDPSVVTATLYSRASGKLTFRLASQ